VANIKSQIKRNRQNEKRRLRNKSVRAELRTRSKNAVVAAEAGAEDSVEVLRLAVKRIDKAAAKGVIHKNTAANHKSRLVRRVAASGHFQTHDKICAFGAPYRLRSLGSRNLVPQHERKVDGNQKRICAERHGKRQRRQRERPVAG